MMKKIFHEKSFGYFVGTLLILTSVVEYSNSNLLNSFFWLILGAVIIFDTWQLQ